MILPADFTPTVRAFAPGRTELAGNHTDHQGGRVIAASTARGVQVLAAPNNIGRVRLESTGFPDFDIDVEDLAPHSDEVNTTAAIVRGMVAGCRAIGIQVQGFDARVTSTLPAGGGLSSSAACELALGCAMNTMFGTGEVPPLVMARLGFEVERDYFGKPCGLMDQATVALGGIVAMDFKGLGDPRVSSIDFSFVDAGYEIVLVDTGCDHSLFTTEFAQIVHDMCAVAQLCGGAFLSDVDEEVFLAKLGDVRAELGDAATLRGIHYFNEMRLVDARERDLRAGDMASFLANTRSSGRSSAQYLQNVSAQGVSRQPAMVTLALTDLCLAGRGSFRMHAGGFGGSVQAFVPIDYLDEFVAQMEGHLVPGCCRVLRIGGEGAHAERL